MLRSTLTVEIIAGRFSRQRRALSDVTSLILSKHLSPSGTGVVFGGKNGVKWKNYTSDLVVESKMRKRSTVVVELSVEVVPRVSIGSGSSMTLAV